MLRILGVIPYVVVGVVLATVGMGIDKWQLWAVLACMLVSDGISWFRGSQK